MKEKKKQLKKDGKPPTVEEDDPEVVSYNAVQRNWGVQGVF